MSEWTNEQTSKKKKENMRKGNDEKTISKVIMGNLEKE